MPGTVFAGEFRIVKALSAGGMGAVYVAEQASTGKLRALKLMHPTLLADPRLRGRFEQEARVGALIKSDHVVQVIGAGVDADTGVPWLAMELLEGEDLATSLRRRGCLPPAEVYDIFRQMGHALGAAHAVGVVHRDIKPENVCLAQTHGAAGGTSLKILDFGIAKVVAEAKTMATAAIGTPMWMAPEQTDPLAPITPATDVWPLGLMAFTMLTGKVYWRAANDPMAAMTALMREILLEPLPPASHRAMELGCAGMVPAGFDAWFSRCLQRDLAMRFANAAEALAVLGPALSGGVAHVSVAPPPSVAMSSGAAPTNMAFAPTSALMTPGQGILPAMTTGGAAALSMPPAAPATGTLQSAGMTANKPRRTPLGWIVGGVLLGVLGTVGAWAVTMGPGEREEEEEKSAEVKVVVAAAGGSSPHVTISAAASAPASTAAARAPTSKATSASKPSAGAAPSAVPSVSASVAVGGTEPRPFDYAAANKEIQAASSRARLFCKARPGPRVVSGTVYFKPSGAAQRVSMDPQVMAASSGICVMGELLKAHVPAFDSTSLQPMPATVALD